MEKENAKEIKMLSKMLGADRLLSSEDTEKILGAIFTMLTNFKKSNLELNESTKKEVDDVLKTLKILQKELYQDIKDGKKEMEIQCSEYVDDVKYLIDEFKKMKPKDGYTPKKGVDYFDGDDADEETIISKVLTKIRDEIAKDEEMEIEDDNLIQKINDLDYTKENLIDVRRIKGWENLNKNSRKAFSPTVIGNAMDLDLSEKADGYAIVWDETNQRYKFAASGGGGGGSGTVNSGTQYRLAYYATTGTAVSQLAAITADRVLISNANGLPTHSTVTATTLGYLDATSSIQTQINAKISASSTDSLSNKTINLTSNTLTGTLAQFNVALSDADFLSQAGTETVTNKTIDASLNTISNITTSMFASNVIDVDSALSANSDSRLATQKAVKSYVDASVTGLLDLKGSTDCSTNPNYPSALKGDSYYVTVAGKIGGASGKTVEIGDVYVALADNAGGTEASVGTSWFVLNQNLTGVALTTSTLAQFAATTSAQLAGVISDETGSGALVFATSPTLVTPVLGVATATSINKVAITAPATSATLTIANGKTLTANASITLTGTDSSALSLAGNLTTAGAFAITFTSTATTSLTLPTTGTLATLAGAETLSSKTLTTPIIVDAGYISDDSNNELLKFSKTASAVNEITIKNAATGNGPQIQSTGGDTNIDINLVPKGTGIVKGELKRFQVQLIAETTDQTTGTSKGGDYRISNRAITIKAVGAYCDTAGTTGVFTVDINEAGTTILSTKITVDSTEKSSETAATPPVISDASIAADAIITFDVDGIQTTAAKGLKVWIDYVYA